MAAMIGVRELKNKASEIVREVHEREAEYIVTLRGEPVAVLSPLSARSEHDLRRSERENALVRLDDLATRIAQAWKSPKGSRELIEEQRR